MTERGKPPHSTSTLDRWVYDFASEHDLVEKRVRDWISYMIFASKLEEASAVEERASFIIKGGVALEMRLRDRARATEDLDLIVDDTDTDARVTALQEALSGDYQDFTFRVKDAPHPAGMGNGFTRLEVALEYRGRGWGTIQVDVSPSEDHTLEKDRVSAISLEFFGLETKEDLPCLSTRYHLAHKIHGMTSPGTGADPNERFHDLVDLFLLRGLIADEDQTLVREACVEVFEVRSERTWPPEFSPPRSWEGPFERAAERIGLETTDFDDAVGEARSYIFDIDAAR